MADNAFAFGKHRGKTFAEVAKDKGYVTWCKALPDVKGQMKEFVDYVSSGEGLPSSQSPGASSSPQSGLGWASNAPASASDAPQCTLAVEIVSGCEFQIGSPGPFIPTALWKELSSWPEGRVAEDKKSWRFPLEEYKSIIARLRVPLFEHTSVDYPPPWVFQALDYSRMTTAELAKEAAESLESFLLGLPPEVQAERPVMQFQKEGIEFGISRAGRCLLGDEMGLGKTLQALAIAAQYHDEWPCLVVAPSTLRFVWRDQALQWLPHIIQKHQVQVLMKGGQALDSSAKLVVISYDLLTRHERYHCRADGESFKVVLVDESHYIKDAKSKRTQTVLSICKAAERIVLISGTPALNRAAELHTQLQALLPSVPKFHRYVERYCEKQTASFGGRPIIKYVGAKHTAELNTLLTGTVMIRRLKKDVLTQLPKKRRQRITLDPAKLNATIMKEVKADMEQQQASMEALRGEGGMMGSNALTQTFKRTAEAKIDSVCDYVEYLIGEDVKFLLFAHHHAMLDALEDKVKSLKTKYIRIDGKTPMGSRNDRVDKFQQDESCQVAILSITACGQGLTLTAAHTVVFAELYWVPGQMLQAEDRAHRIGQEHSVDVQYCIAEGTLDETIFGSMNKKQRDTSGILDGNSRCMDAWRSSAAPAAPIRENDISAGLATQPEEAPQEAKPRKRQLEAGQQGLAKFFKAFPSASQGSPAAVASQEGPNRALDLDP